MCHKYASETVLLKEQCAKRMKVDNVHSGHSIFVIYNTHMTFCNVTVVIEDWKSVAISQNENYFYAKLHEKISF